MLKYFLPQNCGFLVNKDEWGCRLGHDTAWSFGTITVLVTIWVAIVTILMLATVFLLQWNRITFRTPLDLLAESRGGPGGTGGARPGGNIPITTTSDRREAGHVMSTTTAADPRTGGMVSIMVMYRPPGNGQQAGGGGGESKTGDLPPTYDSLFLGENPPGYNMLTVNLPHSGQTQVSEPPSDLGASGETGLTEASAGEENGSDLLVSTVVEEHGGSNQQASNTSSLASVKILPALPASDNSQVRPEMTVE